jgi:hypothetical protein
MPRLIDFGDKLGGVVSFPDDATDEQIVGNYNQIRDRALGSARMNLQGALTEVERQEPGLEKYLVRGGLALGEQTGGAAKQVVGNIARTLADVFTIPRSDLQRTPDVSDPELPINILREAGRSLEEEGSAQRRAASELGESIGGGVGPAIVESLAGTAGISATTLPAAVFGLGPAAVAAATQSYALNLSDFRDTLKARNPNLSEDEVFQKAQVPAALAGTATGVLTRGFGGVERFVERIAREGIGKEGVKALLRDAFRSASLEFPEEYGDQLATGFTEKAFVNPDKPVGEIFNEAGMAGLAGFALGGLTTGAIAAPFAAASAVTEPSRMRRGEQRRRRVISLEVEQGRLLPQEGTQYAEGIRTITPTPGQEVAPGQEEGGGVRVRDVAQDRLETEAGAPLTRIATTPVPATELGVAPVISAVPSEQVFESRAPVRVPIQIQSADGSVREGEFTGYYDMRELGRGVMASVGWTLPNGTKTHGMLRADEKMIGPVPTFDEWQAGQTSERRQPVPGQGLTPDVIISHLATRGLAPGERILITEDPAGEWDAKSVFRGNQLQRIELNASKLTSTQSIDTAIDHELAHVVSIDGSMSHVLDQLSADEKADIMGDMIRLGYNPTLVEEIEARGTEQLANAWKGRNWFEQLIGRVLALAQHIGLPMTRLGAERISARAIHNAFKEVQAQSQGTINEQGEVQYESRVPQFFQTRKQVEAAVQNPGISASQQQQARDLAAVQSTMSPDTIVGWLMQTPRDQFERFAQKKLDYIEDRRHLSNLQQSLVTMTTATPDDVRAKEVSGAQILGHYGVDRAMERKINNELETAQGPYAKAVAKLGKLNINQIKANFLTALFNRLTSDYRVYLNDKIANAPASGNVQSQYRQALANAERRLNDQVAPPIAVQRALSAIAANLPTNLLVQGTTNQQIVDWVNQQGVLFNVVGDDVRTWLLIDDGSGSPALLGYTRLLEDMNTLRDLLLNQQTIEADIKAFENWFRPSGKAKAVSAKKFAEDYFKFRTARDKALGIVKAINKEIDKLDLQIRGNTIARDRLQSMMVEPKYVSTVREAARVAHVVVRALYDSQDNKTGLIERDKTVGRWRMTGPLTNTEYVVDLYPSSSQEQANRTALMEFVTEARLFAQQNMDSNPLLSDEYNNLAEYIERYLVHPSLDPAQGFIQDPWMGIPGTNIRIPLDPFDMWSALTGPLFRTVRDTLERIGGRAVKQAVLDGHELDRTMRRVEAVNANKTFGYAAQVSAVLKAIKSHGWNHDQFSRWDEEVAERVLAAGQNNLGPSYEIGDTIIGSGVVLTREDVDAMKLMKQWEDAVLSAAPRHVMEQLGDLGISRKAIGSGRFTVARVAAPWTHQFMIEWADAKTDDAKWNLLGSEENFRRIILGYLGEFNPEFSRMNPASPNKTELFEVYRRLALTEKMGVQSFNNIDDVLDFVANEMVSRNISPDFTTAKTSAQKAMLADIKAFITAFENGVINYKSTETYGGVPPAVIQSSTANNSFTTPRGQLVAPSTFYTYSTASDGRRLRHVGSLRSLLNLKLMQSGREAMASIGSKKTEMDEQIQKMVRSGMPKGKATSIILKQTAKDRKANKIRYDYKELVTALSGLEKVFGSLERFEASVSEHYEHAGVAALNNVFGTVKSFLLSSTQAITTNYWSGTLLGPAIFHWQAGQYLKSLQDVIPAPHLWKTIIARVSDIVASNPAMAKLLKVHAPLWNTLAENIVKASHDWRRIQQIAEQTGMVTPYNLGDVLANKAALKRTAGRLESATDSETGTIPLMQWSNAFLSAPGVRHIAEGVKAVAPRLFDNMINYSLVASFERDMDFLAKNGWTAFQARETAAAPGYDWKDLSNPDNVLVPGDLGLSSHKGLDVYRNLFAPLGSLDRVLLDYYERTKTMTPEQRKSEPLIQSNDDYAAMALEYAAITNVATETRRSFALKGKGSDGLWRNIVGTFMGWVTNMTKQFSKAMQTHSADSKAVSIWRNMLGLATIIVLLSAVGAWNWEFGDEFTKLVYNQTSARIQPGNIQDVETGVLYFVQALVNTVPVFGPMAGNLAGLAFTGRGQPFDPASLMPAVGFALGTWNTVKRIVQTGDAVLPMADWSRQWMPFTKIVLNRAPIISGIVDQQNAVRSLNASAPPGTEIKWGQRGVGEMRYSPANDEIQKLISSAYDVVARGGNVTTVQQRLNDAIAAYVATGRSQEDASKAVVTALASKEPIRILTGKEMTPEEEQRWVKRMTPEQKANYDRAVAAWGVLGQVTGKDMDMVTVRGSGGGRGGASASARLSPITGLPLTRRRAGGGGGLLRLAGVGISAPSTGTYQASALPRISRVRRARRAGAGRSRLRRSLRGISVRRRSPRITVRRRRLGVRRGLGYVRA